MSFRRIRKSRHTSGSTSSGIGASAFFRLGIIGGDTSVSLKEGVGVGVDGSLTVCSSLAWPFAARLVECLLFLFNALARPLFAAASRFFSTQARSSFNRFCVQPVAVLLMNSMTVGLIRFHVRAPQRAQRARRTSSSGNSHSGVRHMTIRSIRYAPVSSASKWIVSPRKASVNRGRAGNSAMRRRCKGLRAKLRTGNYWHVGGSVIAVDWAGEWRLFRPPFMRRQSHSHNPY